MTSQDVIGFFITWTVYGTHLQDAARGWRRWRGGPQQPQLKLVMWRKERLKFDIVLLNKDQRAAVEAEIDRVCQFKQWKNWARAARSNHVHVVASAKECAAQKVRDQLKANCTRRLREGWPVFIDRPVWTEGGDCEWLHDEDELNAVIEYVLIAQDRKHLDEPGAGS